MSPLKSKFGIDQLVVRVRNIMDKARKQKIFPGAEAQLLLPARNGSLETNLSPSMEIANRERASPKT